MRARFAALTLPHRFGEVATQLAAIDQALAGARDTALVVIPETALTGYFSSDGDYDLRWFAEPRGGQSEQALYGLAKKHGVALLAPLVEKAGEQFYNSTVLIDSGGQPLLRYRKRHPWFPETWATPSNNPVPVISFCGVSIAVCICFDIHFVVRDAKAALQKAEVLLFPSEWTEEEDSRPALLGDIAKRFDLTIVNANWGVGVPSAPGQGHSLIVTPTDITRSTGPLLFVDV